MVTSGLVTLSSIEEYNKTAAALVELETRYKGVRYEVTTKLGLLAATTARKELRTLRVALENKRVEIKAPALKRTQEIDAEAKRLTKAIEALEDPIDAQIKEEEQRKENDRLAAERAEQEKREAEQRAIREAEERKLQAERDALAKRQAEIDRVEREQRELAAAAQRKIEEDARASRLKIEQEERAARLAREEQDRIARAERDEADRIIRGIQEAKELELQRERDRLAEERLVAEAAQRQARERDEALAKIERDRVEAEFRSAEEKKRKAKEKEAERQREVARRANNVLDANAMLSTFVERFGQLEEFAAIAALIAQFLNGGPNGLSSPDESRDAVAGRDAGV